MRLAIIEELRREKGITQKKLAIAAGISQSQIANIVSGNSDTCLETLLAILNELDTQLILRKDEKEYVIE